MPFAQVAVASAAEVARPGGEGIFPARSIIFPLEDSLSTGNERP